MAKECLLATAALGSNLDISKNVQNGRHKQRSGQHSLARQKNKQKRDFSGALTRKIPIAEEIQILNVVFTGV